jgi:anti-sigma factor RsiW
MIGVPIESCPAWRTLMHGFVDGELDVTQAAQFEDHLSNCVDCRAELDRVIAVKEMLDKKGLKWRPPKELHSQITAVLSFEQAAMVSHLALAHPASLLGRSVELIRRWSFIPSLAALTAASILFVNAPSQTLLLQDQIMASHVRSMMADHLTDVLTSDQHTVKPWFNGKIDFSPPVSDLTKEGFPLVGGRVDYIGGRAVAALVYRRHGHIINLFTWPTASDVQTTTVRDGYNMKQWSEGGLVFWAISDVAPGDLAEFETFFRSSAKA